MDGCKIDLLDSVDLDKVHTNLIGIRVVEFDFVRGGTSVEALQSHPKKVLVVYGLCEGCHLSNPSLYTNTTYASNLRLYIYTYAFEKLVI